MLHARKHKLILKKQPLQEDIIVQTRTILNTCLDVVAITEILEIPKSFCKKIQAKKGMLKNTICLTDADYDYIWIKYYIMTKFILKVLQVFSLGI